MRDFIIVLLLNLAASDEEERIQLDLGKINKG